MTLAGASGAAVVEAMFLAWAEGRVDDVLALVDPAVVWQPITRPGRTVYQGKDGTRQMIADLGQAWGPFRVELAEVTECSDGTVLVHGESIRTTDEGDLPGVPFECVITVRDGLVHRLASSPA